MKPASLHFAFLLLLLLSATAATAQLMRKDTTSFPHSKWEVGLDLKPIWDKSEPYNFVVRYFFKDKWALRGGVGLELNWSNDTLDIVKSQLTVGTPTYIYDAHETQKDENLYIQVFIGIHYELRRKNLSWYSAFDLFYTSREKHYNVPYSVHGRASEEPLKAPEFVWISSHDNTEATSGIRLINGFRYHLTPSLSTSTEIALTAQSSKYRSFSQLFDVSVYDTQTTKEISENGWNYSVKIAPLFRLFINYHF